LQAAAADAGSRPVSNLIDAWLADHKQAWAMTHMRTQQAMVSRFIRPMLGEVSCARLTRADVEACLKAPKAESAQRHLRAAMGGLLSWGYAAADPWISQPKVYYMPSSRRKTAASVEGEAGADVSYIEPALIPDAHNLRELADAMRLVAGRARETDGELVIKRPDLGDRAWLMVAIAASCGVRQGELFALTCRQLLIEDGELLADRQIQRKPGGGVLITKPKWGKIRKTVLPSKTIWGAPLHEPLREYVTAMKLKPDDIVFPTTRRQYMHPSNFLNRWFDPAREQVVGWHEKWVWHSLRHSFCSLMIRGDEELGRKPAALADVSLCAGHQDVGVTQRMYISTSRGAIGRLNSLYETE
jgi:integrase